MPLCNHICFLPLVHSGHTLSSWLLVGTAVVDHHQVSQTVIAQPGVILVRIAENIMSEQSNPAVIPLARAAYQARYASHSILDARLGAGRKL